MTLTEAAYWTRRFGIIVVGMLSILIIIIVFILNAPTSTGTLPEYLNANYACTPKKEEFLKEKLEIPSLELAEGSDKQFSLETETGQADQLTRIVNVYKYDNSGQALDSQNEAKNIASKLGFDPLKMQREGTTYYTWTDTATSKSLKIRASDLNVVMKTDYTKSGAYPLDTSLPTDEEAKNMASAVLRGAGLMTTDYAAQKPTITLIKIEQDGTLSEAKAKVDADLIRIDFERRKPIISFPSNVSGAATMKEILEKEKFTSVVQKKITSEGQLELYDFTALLVPTAVVKSNISVYIGPQNKAIKFQNLSNVYQIEYNNFPIQDQFCGTYQLIPRSQALQTVQKGGGSLVYLNEKNGDTVRPYVPRKVTKFTIYQIQLKYYDPPEATRFLQPIYVIHGEATFDTGLIGEFYYYVPAINYDQVTDKVIPKVTPTPSGTSSTSTGLGGATR
jgi:hypothetical protein